MATKKNLLEDIKPISRGPRMDSMGPRASASTPRTPTPPLPREVSFEPSEPKHSSRYGLWYIAAACIIGLLFSLSFLFEHATVTITPKSLALAFDNTDTFTAVKDSTTDNTIVYTQMTLSGDESMKLPSSQSKQQSIPATGTVVLYNNYSAAVYKLVKSTRLATTDGKIYRLNTAVTIPGYTKTGSVITPGSVEANVTAAVAGEGSNIDNSDLTIPGLAGTPQATKIYGRTKGPISGGISGTLYSIPQDAANAAVGTLQTKLKTSLIAKAKVQVPDGYIFYDGATIFKADDSVQAPYSKDQDIPIALHGTLVAYLVKQDTLVKAIAKKMISQYADEPITISKIESLTLVPSVALQPDTDTTLNFALSGSATAIWTIDPDAIKNLLAGKKKSTFESILGAQMSVDRAEVVIKPFWKSSFPADPARISVNVK